MLKEAITFQGVVDYLNRLAEVDNDAVTALLKAKVPCNQAMAEHPTVQVGIYGGVDKVGILGVLNGMFGVFPEDHPRAGYGPITVIMGPGERTRFVLTTEA